MYVTQVLMRPAAAEVRSMLHRIKMDNMKRGQAVASGSKQHQHHQQQLGPIKFEQEHHHQGPEYPAFRQTMFVPSNNYQQ